eukprot:671285-Lingulodinium_polyedra.AAC.1
MSMGEDHPLAYEEDQWCRQLVRLGFSLMGCRWGSMLWHCQGLPGRLALLLSDKPEEVQGCLVWLRKVWLVWGEASSVARPKLKHVLSRSFMNFEFVKQ